MATTDDPWSQTITVGQAYKAVQELVFAYWEVGGKNEDQIAIFGSALNGDPALEDDWLDAVKKVRG